MNRLFILTQVVFFFSQSLFAQSIIDSALTVANESQVIEVDNSYRKGNYEALIKSIGERRIVCLGEFNHGCGEIFASRIDIIRQLHDQLGFNTILFESGLGEVGVIDIKKDDLTENQLVNGFFGPWRTAEFQELVAYARSENLDIAGFDVQRTGTIFTAFLSEKQSEFKSVEEEFVAVKRLLGNRRAVYDSVKDRTNELIDTYNKLADSWEGDKFVRKVLLDRAEFLRYKLEFTKTKDYTERWKARDVAMANNVKWLLAQLDDSEKVIIVGHNFHIARYNEKETVMGEILDEQYGDDMFVLGVFAATGTFHNNARNQRLYRNQILFNWTSNTSSKKTLEN